MPRIILVIVLAGLAFLALRRLWQRRPANPLDYNKPAFEQTVQCARCNTYVSRQLAFERDNRYYCCREHLPEQHHAE